MKGVYRLEGGVNMEKSTYSYGHMYSQVTVILAWSEQSTTHKPNGIAKSNLSHLYSKDFWTADCSRYVQVLTAGSAGHFSKKSVCDT